MWPAHVAAHLHQMVREAVARSAPSGAAPGLDQHVALSAEITH
jgi:hypothetical protein